MAEETSSMSVTFDDYAPPVAAAKPEAAAPEAEAKAEPVKAAEPVLEIPDIESDKEVDPYLERARATGYKTRDEWTGDPRKYRDIEPRVWVESEPLAKAYKESKEQVRRQQKTITSLQQHYKVVHETAYNRAFEDLQAKKDAAVLEQDVEKVRQVDQEIAMTRAQQIKTAPVVENPPDPAYGEWIAGERGKKIHEDKEMWPEAQKFETALQADLTSTVESRLAQVEEYMKFKFPHKYSNPRRQAPPMVEGVGPSAPMNGGARRFSVNDLTKDQREMMGYLVESKTLTQEQYLKDIASARNGAQVFTIGD